MHENEKLPDLSIEGSVTKCHWCEKETANEPQMILNGLMEYVMVSFCDRCKEANEIDPHIELK